MPRISPIERKRSGRACLGGAHARNAAKANAAETNAVAAKREPAPWARLPFAASIIFAVSLACFVAAVSVYLSFASTIANTATFALRGAGVAAEDAASLCAVNGQGIAAPFVFWSEKGDTDTFSASGPGAPTESSGQSNLGDSPSPSSQIKPFDQNDPNNSSHALASRLRYCGDIGLLLPDIPAYPAKSGKHQTSDGASDEPANDPTSSDTGNQPASDLAISGSTDEPASSGVTYNRLTTARLDADGFPVTAEAIRSTMQVECDELDYRLLSFASYTALFLYPATLGIQTALHCRHIRKTARHSAFTQVFGYILPSIAAIAATVTFAASLSEYGSYFPTRWSDFPA